MNEWKNTCFTTMDVLQCVYIPYWTNTPPMFPWDCKGNKNLLVFSGGSVTEHWPSTGQSYFALVWVVQDIINSNLAGIRWYNYLQTTTAKDVYIVKI